jgi:ParB family transcriptional regulator, chromosome partitioning protein
MSDKRLGRGLEALLGPISREQAEASGALKELPVSSIRANPFQPRTRLDEGALAELAASIEASGLLQPIVVRPKNGAYELIAGERRWRAVQQLGWRSVPAVIKEVDNQTLLTLALIENLQRHDLSAIDEALGYHRLMDEFRVPQTEVARIVGRNRSTVANLLRLLRLPAEVQALIHEGKLSEGHGRALVSLDDSAAMVQLATESVERGLSVRDLEARVRGDVGKTAPPSGAARIKRVREPHAATADARRIEDALRRRLGTDIRVTAKRKGRGLVSISYYSNDDLARLLELILGEPFAG